MKILIIARHGQTESNKQGKLNSFEDININSIGESQARQSGQALKKIKIDLVVCSPLIRAKNTANIIIGEYSKVNKVLPEIIIDNRLQELNFGELEGLTQEEIRSKGLWPTFLAWRNETDYKNPKKAEDFEDAEDRAQSLFNELLKYKEDTILLVSHGHFSRIFVSKCILGSNALHHRRLRFDNAKFIDVIIENGKPRMIGFNLDKLNV